MNGLKLSTLDFLISVADSRTRPLDFALILHLRNSLRAGAFKSGAKSARFLFPTTGSHVRGRRWILNDTPEAGVKVSSSPDDRSSKTQIDQFLNCPFDPGESFPVEQLIIINGKDEARKLVTRFHHVAADGLSAVMWLRHQMRIAYGLEQSRTQRVAPDTPLLREHRAPARKSMFSFQGRSEQLWRSGSAASQKRGWTTFQINAASLRERCRKAGGFTYNDLLATSLLEVLSLWNKTHGTKRPRNVSLWFPVNIRNKPMSGFGNGSSRIRIYTSYDESLSLADKCRSVRRQISWSMRNGEWAIPTEIPFDRWPLWAIKPLLRGYLSRPSVDMCTSVFSHVEKLGALDDQVFHNIEQVECVGLLHKSHCLAVNAATIHGRTWITFTYDPNLLNSTDIDRLIELYKEQVSQALREL